MMNNGYSARDARRYGSPGRSLESISAGGAQAGGIKQIGGATIHPDSVAYLAAQAKAKAGGDSSKLAALWGGNIVQDQAWAKVNGLVWSEKANRWVYPNEKIESPTGVHKKYLGGDKWQDVVWSDAANRWVPVSGNAASPAQPQQAAPAPQQPPPPAPPPPAPAAQQPAQPQAPAPKQQAAPAQKKPSGTHQYSRYTPHPGQKMPFLSAPPPWQGAAAPIPPKTYAGWKPSKQPYWD